MHCWAEEGQRKPAAFITGVCCRRLWLICLCSTSLSISLAQLDRLVIWLQMAAFVILSYWVDVHVSVFLSFLYESLISCTYMLHSILCLIHLHLIFQQICNYFNVLDRFYVFDMPSLSASKAFKNDMYSRKTCYQPMGPYWSIATLGWPTKAQNCHQKYLQAVSM